MTLLTLQIRRPKYVLFPKSYGEYLSESGFKARNLRFRVQTLEFFCFTAQNGATGKHTETPQSPKHHKATHFPLACMTWTLENSQSTFSRISPSALCSGTSLCPLLSIKLSRAQRQPNHPGQSSSPWVATDAATALRPATRWHYMKTGITSLPNGPSQCRAIFWSKVLIGKWIKRIIYYIYK